MIMGYGAGMIPHIYQKPANGIPENMLRLEKNGWHAVY
jgi:hypothetical protein